MFMLGDRMECNHFGYFSELKDPIQKKIASFVAQILYKGTT